MKTITVEGLPAEPLAAAGFVQQNWLPLVEKALAEGVDVALVLPSADHTHREWRRAIAAMLARAHAPLRVNCVAGEGEKVDATLAFLATAPGVTGQYLET